METILLLLNFITGTLCLILGVKQMSWGLEKAASPLLHSTLTRLTSSLPLAFLTGTVITALLQSSTAVTVITVSLVNSGLIKLNQAIGIIYGANIGTTLTAQLMSFNITQLAFPLLLLGLFVRCLFHKSSLKSMGVAIQGLGFLFLGMAVLHRGVPLIRDNPWVYRLLNQYGSSLCVGLLIGMIVTLLVQSSSATVGMTIVLFNAGLIEEACALGLMLGDNIGTCFTAQLASLHAKTSARRAAWAHTLYNVMGVLLVLCLQMPFMDLVNYITAFLGQDATKFVANAHTLFNLCSALIFLPLTPYYVRFLETLIPDKTAMKGRNHSLALRK